MEVLATPLAIANVIERDEQDVADACHLRPSLNATNGIIDRPLKGFSPRFLFAEEMHTSFSIRLMEAVSNDDGNPNQRFLFGQPDFIPLPS
jgi:hypothetical protein